MNVPADRQFYQREGIPPYFWPEYRGPLRLPPLPQLAEIARARQSIPNARWRLAYGLLATYGIRPGELMDLRGITDGDSSLRVRGRAGERLALPSPAHWVDEWDLRELSSLPRPSVPQGTTVAAVVAAKFRRDYPLPFELRCLRLAYYQRILEGEREYSGQAS